MSLPKFEKSKPIAGQLRINGFGTDDNDVALAIGSNHFFLVEARIDAVEHVEKTAGVIRLHKARIIRHAVFEDEDVAKKLLETADEIRREREEAEAGITRLPGMSVDPDLDGLDPDLGGGPVDPDE